MTTGTMRTIVHAMAMEFMVELEAADPSVADTAVHAFQAELDSANSIFSLWSTDSEVSRLRRGELTLDDASPSVREVARLCDHYAEVSGGAFSPYRGDGTWDPTGIVKSWAVVNACRAFETITAQSWIVGASGDVLTSLGQVRRIGISDPRVQGDPGGTPVIDVVELGGVHRALATSGGANHPGHIWDPATGLPASSLLQVSVVGNDFVECDAFATAIMAGGEAVVDLARRRGLEALVVLDIKPDGTLRARNTPGWPTVES